MHVFTSNNYLLKVIALNYRHTMKNLNDLFEQTFVGWDSRHIRLYVRGNCGFYIQMCQYLYETNK